MNDETAERFARLESHLAHLEHQVEQLNEVVIEQGKTIDRLVKQMQMQSRALETFEIERTKANNPKPPHY
jgi:SlyX protein